MGLVVLETATTAAALPAGAVSRDRGHIFDAADLEETDWRQGARTVAGGRARVKQHRKPVVHELPVDDTQEEADKFLTFSLYNDATRNRRRGLAWLYGPVMRHLDAVSDALACVEVRNKNTVFPPTSTTK